MAFFQNSVINKYIQNLDKQTLQNAYAKFRAHFHNATIQENIRGSKEEQYQGEFLIDLFVNVFGYTKNPTPNFNLTTEYKNVKDSKKADGAIIINEIVKAVIELKGTNTTDLNKIEVQAFGYKNNQPECEYVITSNFEKIRFYIDNAIEYTEFNLFTLTEKEFELLYICLSYDSIAKGLPKQIKDESVSQESLITKKLYNDYSQFKNELYHSLVKLNPQYEPLELFKKSQKLLDRFLFIFFAEDRQLLPTNLIFRINKEWQQLRNMRIEVSLYDRYKIYFNDLDQGAKVSLPAFSQTASKQVEEFQIYAYNGGLFKTDDLLNDIKIEDELLFAHTEKLSNYDFASEVDVNVLGHIFENSLNDLDEIKAQLEGQEVDKTKTKRKKDGVFYTPKYITKYIVDNTVGKLCLEKKEELQLVESDYTIDKKRQKKTTQDLTDKLNEYRNWLLQLTICDPACGSGAFLNQALDFLITEHRYIDELQAKLFGDAIVLSDVEGSILENNLFGVDINEESVEIAKLSLWLRTAQPNRKLNDLNRNIKCGNSLIDDATVAGDKAFNWVQQFTTVFEKGGFDVVIGNPPYVQLQSMGSMSDKLKNIGFETYEKGADLYCLFSEKGYNLLKSGGIQSFIMPNKWMIVSYGKPLRKFLSKTGLTQMLNFGDIQFFDGAATIICIFVTQKKSNQSKVKVLSLNQRNYNGDFFTAIASNAYEYSIDRFDENEWIIKPFDVNIKLDKMKEKGVELKNLPIDINYGIKTGFNDAFYIDEETKKKLILEDPKSADIIKKMIRGRDIIPYGFSDYEYLINSHNGIKSNNNSLDPIDIDEFPAIKKHLNQYYNALENRSDKGNTPYNLRSCAYLDVFSNNKIIYPNMTSLFPFMYDESGVFANQKCFILSTKDENVSLLALTAILNSSLCKLWINYNCPELLGGTREISKVYFEKFPVPIYTDKVKALLENNTKQRIIYTNDFQASTGKFEKYFSSQYQLEKLSGKLENWYTLEFLVFIKELNKSIKAIKGTVLTKKDEFDWIDLFNENKQKAQALKSQIDAIDKEIDQIVYKLYDLTEDEIEIVEGA